MDTGARINSCLLLSGDAGDIEGCRSDSMGSFVDTSKDLPEPAAEVAISLNALSGNVTPKH